MAFPSTRYIESPSIQNYFVDHDSGFPLAAGVVTFYRDVERTVLKPIYQQVQLADNTYDFIQLPNPITLNSVGTYDDGNGNDINVFLYPHVGSPLDVTVGALDLYFVTVYSSDGRLQETREAWPPNAENNASTSSSFDGTDNVILNPQFVDVYFIPDPATGTMVYNVTTSGQVSIVAPGWDLVTEGSGAITVSQVPISDTAAPSNPPYALSIQLGVGVTSCFLRQRIYSSPRFLKDNILSGYFIVKSNTAATPFLTLNYKPSSSTTSTLLQQICSGTALVGSFNPVFNETGVTITIVNPDVAPTGYVDIYLDIPPLSDIQVSSFQVISVANAETVVDFVELSTPQQINEVYNYDRQALFFKPISSFLVGWDFPLNPSQLGAAKTITTTPAYIWDQTICACSSGNVGVVRSAPDTNTFYATTTANNQSFYLLQYLSGVEATELSLASLSVNIHAYCLVNPTVTVRAYLFAGSSISTIPALPVSLGTINSAGEFTLTAANWAAIPQSPSSFTKRLLNSSYTDSANDLKFVSWNPGYGATTNFAIVVTFNAPISATDVVIHSISCVPGDIATRPATKSESETLRDCQFYYQKSFLKGVVPAQNVGTNSGEFYALATAGGSALNSFSVRFATPMRTTPVNPPIFYNPVAANAFIRDFDAGADFFTTALKANTLTANGFIVNGTSAFATVNGNDIGVHFTADARLGII